MKNREIGKSESTLNIHKEVKMTSKKQHLFQALLLTGAMATMAPVAALAATAVGLPNNYTPACTKIDNTAHVDCPLRDRSASMIADRCDAASVRSPSSALFAATPVRCF